MSVYDLNGNEIDLVYDKNGNTISQAYDINGNPLINTEPVNIKVMSYNVRWWQNFNSQQTMQEEIISTYTPDIIGFQEFSRNTNVPTVGANVLVDYPAIRLSNHFNFNALASKYTLYNLTSADYQTQDQYDIDTYHETRSYMKCYMHINGKNICWLNTHLCCQNSTPQYAQMLELFNMAEQEEYVIITGDFNSHGMDIESDDYIGLYKQYVDSGYHLINSTLLTGFTKTWTSSTTATSTTQMTYPHDNIITSSNINIISAYFDDTKFSYLNGEAIDHIPLVAKLQIR